MAAMLAAVGVLTGCVSSSKTAAPAVTPTPSPTVSAAPNVSAAPTSAAPTVAAPQVIVIQPSPEKTVYVPVPVPAQPTYVAPAYTRAQATLKVILGVTGHPAGPFVPIHLGPDATTSAVMDVYDGQTVTVDCQTYGGSVYGDWGTTTLWDRVVSPEQVIGYLSDEWVHTGSDSQVLPSC